MSEYKYETLLGAIARGWCSKENEHKEMDSVLACAIADEVWKDFESLQTELDKHRELVEYMQKWARAYPLDVFPEPDMKEVRRLLESPAASTCGIKIDAVSVSNMRCVLVRYLEKYNEIFTPPREEE